MSVQQSDLPSELRDSHGYTTVSPCISYFSTAEITTTKITNKRKGLLELWVPQGWEPITITARKCVNRKAWQLGQEADSFHTEPQVGSRERTQMTHVLKFSKTRLQWHTFPNKATPPKPTRKAPSTGYQKFNIWAYGEYSYSNHHRPRLKNKKKLRSRKSNLKYDHTYATKMRKPKLYTHTYICISQLIISMTSVREKQISKEYIKLLFYPILFKCHTKVYL